MSRLPAIAAVIFCLASAPMPPITTIALADQSDPALEQLFQELHRTDDAPSASQIQAKIWSRWIAYPGDPAADQRMKTGISLMRAGALAQAEALYSDLVGSHPDFAEAWNKRATIRFLRGDTVGSKRDIIKVIELEPRHFGALSGLGMIHLNDGNYQGALQAYEAALDVNPHLSHLQHIIKQLKARLGGETL